MNNEDWIHQNYDRRLILRALDGTAFREVYRPSTMIKQLQPMIEPKKLPANLTGLRKRGLIVKKKLPGRSMLIKGRQVETYVNGWRLTPKGAVMLSQLSDD